MKKSILITLIILFLCVTTVQAESTYTLTVTVKDDDGDSITGATVSINGDTKTTSSNGHATFSLQNGTYNIEVSHDGYDNKEEAVTISDADKTKTVTLTALPEALPNPVADFSGSPLTGTTPLTIQFTDASTGDPSSWYWDFGDGDLSTNQNPSHTYTSAGTYTVSLEVTNEEGKSDTKTRTSYITATDPPGESDPIEYTITRIIKDDDGDPIKGAVVLIKNDDVKSEKWSGSDGSVVFTLLDGTYNVYISAAGYKDTKETLTVSGSNQTDEIEMETGNNIEFIVINADTGFVISGANISVGYENLGVTNNNGRLSDNLKKGGSESYLVVVRRTGYFTNSTTMKIDILDTEIEMQLQELTGSTQTQTPTPTPTPTPIPVQTYGAVDQAEMDRLTAEQEEIQAQIAALEKELEEQQGILNMIMGFFKKLFGMG